MRIDLVLNVVYIYYNNEGKINHCQNNLSWRKQEFTLPV